MAATQRSTRVHDLGRARPAAQMPPRQRGPSAAAVAQDLLVQQVCASLRPPDAAPDEHGVQPLGALDLPSLSFEEILLRTDYQDCIAQHLVSRSALGSLMSTNRTIRDALRRNPVACYLGLFRTPFGLEYNNRLAPHQVRSLRHMHAAEDPPGWSFGELRGGILADDPGLGKTVTVLALVVHSAGCLPALPEEFWGVSASEGWDALRDNPAARQQLLPILNHLRRQCEAHDLFAYDAAARARFYGSFGALLRFQDHGPRPGAQFETIEGFEATLRVCMSAALDAYAAWRPRASQAAFRRGLMEPVRCGVNRVRAGLDKRNRSYFASAVGGRALFERNLLAAPTTLVVVPDALVEHWFEQLRRHVDLRCLEQHGRKAGAVWIDGVGDMAEVDEFRLKDAAAMEEVADEYLLASYTLVVTTMERCAREQRRASSPLMRLRWLRLVVDEGHALGAHEVSAANQFISELPAERRWVMSGTPTVGGAPVPTGAGGGGGGGGGGISSGGGGGGGGDSVAGGSLTQVHRLLGFLREPTYGIGASGGKLWQKQIVRELSPRPADVRARLTALLKPLMVRHTKADLQLPAPIRLPTWEGYLPKLDGEADRVYTNRVCANAADHISTVMAAARREYRAQLQAARTGVGVATGPAGAAAGGAALQRPREPKAVVFSEFINDLEQVTSLLVQSVGQEAVAQHWGVFRSTELAAFRNGKTTYRQCPRCGFHNDVHVKADCCDRRLIEVLLQPHDAVEPPPGTATSDAHAATWPVEQERVWLRDPTALGGFRPWDLRDYDNFRNWAAMGPMARRVWVSTATSVPGSTLPPPTWPTDVGQSGAAPALGGPGGQCYPAVLRGWARCGKWCGPERPGTTYMGCPPCWEHANVLYSNDTTPILRNVAWEKKVLDTYILMLCEDGSHGLDLSFVTHLFILNPIEDQALERQVVSRAHRMGATGPVTVEPIHLWND